MDMVVPIRAFTAKFVGRAFEAAISHSQFQHLFHMDMDPRFLVPLVSTWGRQIFVIRVLSLSL